MHLTRTSCTSPDVFVAHLKRFRAFSGGSSSPTRTCRWDESSHISSSHGDVYVDGDVTRRLLAGFRSQCTQHGF